ncbi:hypothetical protein GYMLUDRAFT_63505 [Collybiopsis luxurians FD-317 M1]|uniref:Uncharacterized protein n=1 Tax=Collybiopsis luxurians FD-317 M1 TaxID=944289 RepID=A0A0D0BGK0_9AGAR|nr:hypothetical protein GYMLUDRAFT_63505 [Collybiopsis luxurians FD-317 M1]
MAANSFLDSLTSPRLDRVPKDTKYPVTDLIQTLLLTAAYEVCSEGYTRNTLSSYLFVSTARDLRDKIHELILDVNSGQGDLWTKFKKYTSLIDPLESALHNFIHVAEKESGVQDRKDFRSLDNYLDWIQNWETNRNLIRSAFISARGLTKGLDIQQNPSLDINQITRQDDRAYFSSLHETEKFKTFRSSLKNRDVLLITGTVLTDFQNLEQGLWDRADEVISLWTVKYAMIINTIVELATKDSPPDDKFKLMAQNTTDLWKAAVALRKSLREAINDTSKATAIQPQWDTLIEALKINVFSELQYEQAGSRVSLPNYIEILALVQDIRRPFHQQAVATAGLFHLLATEFQKEKHQNNLHLLHALKDGIQAIQDALVKSRDILKDMIDIMSLSDDQKQTIDNEFRDAEKEVEGCFTKFQEQLAREDFDSWKQEMKKAKDTDATQTQKWKDFQRRQVLDMGFIFLAQILMTFTCNIQKHAGKPSSEKQVTIEVAIKNAKTQERYTIDSALPLSALLWMIAKKDSKVMTNPLFKDPSKKKIFSMDTIVNEVGGAVILDFS